MKGLFLKELYTVNVYKKSILYLLVIMVAMSVFLPIGSNYVSSMVMVFLVMVMMNLFALDDTAKWDRYALCMPVSRKRIVAVRYLFFAGMVLLGNLFGFLLSAVIAAVRGQENWLLDNLMVSGSLGVIILLLASISIPLCYRFGAEKSRLAMMGIFAVLFMGIIWLMPKIAPVLAGFSSQTATLLVAGIVILVLALYLASYLLSVRIYAKKEF